MSALITAFDQFTDKVGSPFRQFWQLRQPRERTVLRYGAAILSAVLFYLLLIAPAVSGRTRLEKILPLLRQQSAELQSLISRAATFSDHPVAMRLPLNQATIESALLKKNLIAKSIVIGGDNATVQFSGVTFSGLLDWLDEMQKTAHWEVIDININAQVDTVTAVVTLRQQQHE
ncbi:type II secretion system protein GspM [Glaciimonas sp. PAMC28666]|uniref:type II secretion system protein GspM n=1 Tax=Glaciimonas sp. PAMC28666 TaxID=2807626 RepID=UPI001963AC3B|nr:type II secretion system protein GspM [Glaciimonas sp. PAMC28666]QRX82383.1 type II secretion system protein M [Glaciimonas sp. PAMC28666]